MPSVNKLLPSQCRRSILVLGMVALIAACTNSKLLLSPLYNSLDNRIEKRVRELVTLTDQQDASVQAISDDFHLWHRRHELPQYAVLLSEISDHLAESSATRETVDTWFATATAARQRLFVCSPLAASARMMTTLSTDQVKQVSDQLLSSDGDSDDMENTREPHLRVKRTLSLIGFRMQPDQVERLKQMFDSVRSARPDGVDYRAVSMEWNQRFVSLLGKRAEPDFEMQLLSYLEGRHAAFASLRDERVSEMWREYAYSEIQLLTESQRQFAASWLGKLSRTLLALSKDPQRPANGTNPLLPCSPLIQS